MGRGGGAGQPLQIADPGGGVVVPARHQGTDELEHAIGPPPGTAGGDRPGFAQGGQGLAERDSRHGRGRCHGGGPVVHGVGPARRQSVQQLAGPARADPLVQAEQPEPGDVVRRVAEQAHGGDEVLHVRRLDEAKAAVFPVRHPASGQLQLDEITVIGRPYEDGLIPEPRPLLLQLEDAVHDCPRLAGGVVAPHEHRAPAAGPDRVEHQPLVTGIRRRPDKVCHVEDRLERAEVALEPDDGCPFEGPGEVVQMTGIGAPKAVDRLGVVADDRQSAAGRRQQADDVDLERIDVLVLVDEDVVEQARQLRADPLVDKGGPPVEEEVVEVELGAFALAADISLAQRADQLGVVHTPGKVGRDDVCDTPRRVHAP